MMRITIFMLVLGCLNASLTSAQVIITLDHLRKIQSPIGKIILKDNEKFTIEVINTSIACYDYHLKGQKYEVRGRVGALPADRFEIPAIHDERIGSYIVKITKKPEATDCEEEEAILGDWNTEIEVDTYGWNVSFGSGFTADWLTDPVFFLEPGEDTDPSDDLVPPSIVRRNVEAEDEVSLGASAMIHLFHNGEKGWQKYWAPISFGLSVGEEKGTRYLFGSTLRFGSKVYLTGGVVLGDRNRLPNGLQEGSRTSDPNALSTLATKRDVSGFFAISFGFLDFDIDVFNKKLKGREVQQPAANDNSSDKNETGKEEQEENQPEDNQSENKQ